MTRYTLPTEADPCRDRSERSQAPEHVEPTPADATAASRPGETARGASARLEREARQAAALRANLRRRKQQARSRNEPPGS